jgi:hypothetical protein
VKLKPSDLVITVIVVAIAAFGAGVMVKFNPETAGKACTAK